MAKKERYYDEVRRPERLMVVVAAVAAPVWIAIAEAFFPNAVVGTPAWAVGGILGLLTVFVAVGLAAVVVMGRYRAPKAIFVNEVTELTVPEIYRLEPPPYMMPGRVPDDAQGLPQDVSEQLDEEARKARPSYNEQGQLVPWGAIRLGGWRLGKSDRWEQEGKDGILLLVGEDDKMVECFENRIFLAPRVLVRHEEIWIGTLTQLKIATDGWFIPFDESCKLYRLGEMAPEWAAACRKSQEVRSVVLDELGLPGLVRELASGLRREGIAVGPAQQVSFDALAEFCQGWLEKRGVDIRQEKYGPATAAYVWSLYRGLQHRNLQLETDLQVARGESSDLGASLRGRAQQEAALYARGGGMNLTRPTRTLRGAIEDTQGYSMADESRR